MKKRILQNVEIDKIGQKLLKARFLKNEDIEEILSNSMLFEAVQSRIGKEQLGRKSQNRKFGEASNWQKLVTGFSVLTLLVLGAFAPSLILNTDTTPNLAKKTFKGESEKNEFKEQFRFEKADLTTNSIQPSKTKSKKIAKPVSLKRESPKPINLVAKETIRQKAGSNDAEFTPISFGDTFEAAKQDGQIIRVEFSRESILAMGINLPLEDEKPKVKAEFLISSDGIAKGFRIVK